MGIVLFSATALFDGLQGVIGWLGTAGSIPSPASVHHTTVATPRVWHRPRRTPLRPEAQIGQAGVAVARVGMALPAGLRGGAVVDKACPARAARPLRVVRVLDAVATSPSASSAAGRMVISGRMADVCAELDRLAALEAAATTTPALSMPLSMPLPMQ